MKSTFNRILQPYNPDVLWDWTLRLLAVVFLFLAAPLWVFLFLLVKLDSPGPFIYSQRRPGLNRQMFNAYKIRTMIVGADRNPVLAHAVTSRTPEVTRSGRILRRLKLDELPQLWNVVRGDMTFVGPRPIAPSLQNYLEEHIPSFGTRLSVKPGLTSLAQVCIDENDNVENVIQDWAIRFEGERHYLKNRSVTYDLLMILLTCYYMMKKVIRLVTKTIANRLRPLFGLLACFSLSACSGFTIDAFTPAEQLSGAMEQSSTQTSGPNPTLSAQQISISELTSKESDTVYRLGLGDQVAVNIFDEEGLNNLVIEVEGNGTVQLPFIETLLVEGLSLNELQTLLKKAYSSYFVDPWVVTRLVKPRSRPIYLLGEFGSPGVIYMTRKTNIIQAISEGHGLTENAYTRGARLIRDQQIAAVDVHSLLAGGNLGQNIWLEPEDTIYIPSLSDLHIYVFGAVQLPGSKPVNNAFLTLTDAIANSGGPLKGRADLSGVRIVRTHSATRGEFLRVDYEKILEGTATDFPLQPGDILYVPSNVMGTWNDVLEQLLPTLKTAASIMNPWLMSMSLQNSNDFN